MMAKVHVFVSADLAVVLLLPVCEVRADQAEDEAVEAVKKLGGKVTRHEGSIT